MTYFPHNGFEAAAVNVISQGSADFLNSLVTGVLVKDLEKYKR